MKTFLGDYVHWSNVEFNSVRHLPNYQFMEISWREQREYLQESIIKLGPHPLRKEIDEELESLIPKYPAISGYDKISPGDIFKCEDLEISFDPISGAITTLIDHSTGIFRQIFSDIFI